MNNKLIEQIKQLKGVKKVAKISEQIPDSVIVTFEPQEPVLYDEYGVPIFAGGDIFFVSNWTIETDKIHPTTTEVFPKSPCFASIESAERWIEENKPKPIYVDTETGDEFFDRYEAFWFHKDDISIHSIIINKINCSIIYEGINKGRMSNIYKTREKCELALAEFIASKYDKQLIPTVHCIDLNLKYKVKDDLIHTIDKFYKDIEELLKYLNDENN